MSAPILRALTVALAGLACACAPPRTTPPVTEPAPAALADTLRVYAIGEVSTPPSFTNLPDAVRHMARNHPPLMRDAARGGLVVLVLQVGRDGRVRNARVTRSSGEAAMDETAVRVASRLRARPARVGDTPVSVEVEIPFEFGVGP
jgi:TonB family protein